jgi:hypothetical protein
MWHAVIADMSGDVETICNKEIPSRNQEVLLFN